MTKLIAFHLPQYHPIPENDEWWGKGFTEWTNVVRARPLFPGHYQPHLPTDLGFYDLRLPEARQAQADLARAYGIHAFCYYHYWFSGRRILERPVDEILSSGKPDFPFCLCWANENWTRTWDGGDQDILLSQSYDKDDIQRHAHWLVSAFTDRRYLQYDGMPVFLIYNASSLQGAEHFATVLRETAIQAGLKGVHLVRVDSFSCMPGVLPKGFNASLSFQPSRSLYGRPLARNFWQRQLMRAGLLPRVHLDHDIRSYPELVEKAIRTPLPSWTQHQCVTPMWDNSPRRKKGATIFIDSSPELFKKWLIAEIRKSKAHNDDMVFINAWNEWGEGNHLEPCDRWGHSYLEAVQEALQETENE